jgi:ABC-type oligopeptide transport system substrate-binding subunit
MRRISRFIIFGALAATAILAGCGGQQGYRKAFSEQTALSNNSRSFEVPTDKALRTVKQTLVRQGFTIEQADTSTGLIKAVRNMQDKDDNDVSYNINITADITETTDKGSAVTLAASQQTVLHRKWRTWWHLLWIIPIFPTGTEYQTVVTREGNVTDAAFYEDFFAAIEKALRSSDPGK